MATSTATLLHGTLVSTWSLVLAALCFSQIAGPLRALELIDLRRRRGTLSYRFPSRLKRGRFAPAPTRPRATLEDLPLELIALIRTALVDQLNFVRPAKGLIRACTCDQSHLCGCGECFTRPTLAGLALTLPRCDGCLDLVQGLLGTGQVPAQYLDKITTLLEAYGLSMPYLTTLTFPPLGHHTISYAPYSPLILAPSASTSPSPPNSITFTSTLQPSAKVIHLLSSSVPPIRATIAPFRQIVKDFKLVVLPENKMLYTSPAVGTERGDCCENQERGERAKGDPAFFLWSSLVP